MKLHVRVIIKGKFRMLLIDFKGTIRQKNYLGVFSVYIVPNSSNLNIIK